jgi:hypothetical protein
MQMPNCAYDRSKNIAPPPELGEKLMFWRRAYETKILDRHREAVQQV